MADPENSDRGDEHDATKEILLYVTECKIRRFLATKIPEMLYSTIALAYNV